MVIYFKINLVAYNFLAHEPCAKIFSRQYLIQFLLSIKLRSNYTKSLKKLIAQSSLFDIFTFGNA